LFSPATATIATSHTQRLKQSLGPCIVIFPEKKSSDHSVVQQLLSQQGERQISGYRRKPGASALRLIKSAATRQRPVVRLGIPNLALAQTEGTSL